MSFSISWLYLVLGTLTTMVLGAFWYSPLLFAAPWMKALGLKDGDIEESGVPAAPGYLASTLYSLAITWLIGLLATNLRLNGVGEYLLPAAGLWLVTSGLANLRIKYFEDRPWPLYVVDEGYALVAHLMLAVLAWFLG